MTWKDQLHRLKSGFNEMRSNSATEQGRSVDKQPAAAAANEPHVSGQELFHADGPVSADWDAKIGNGDNGWGNQELEHYTNSPENSFYTPEGKLTLRAIANNSTDDPTQRYTSARLVSCQPLGRDRGVLTGVVQSPCADGIWPAFWLLPQEPFAWPTDGEVDIAETWNGDHENHSCLHWGFFHEPQKHLVKGSHLADMHLRPIRYDFAWDQAAGRMIWYIDNQAIMKAPIPEGTRPLRKFTVLLNIAMGGNVCGGKTPADGTYDMVVDFLFLASEPENGGWSKFAKDWESTPLGNTM